MRDISFVYSVVIIMRWLKWIEMEDNKARMMDNSIWGIETSGLFVPFYIYPNESAGYKTFFSSLEHWLEGCQIQSNRLCDIFSIFSIIFWDYPTAHFSLLPLHRYEKSHNYVNIRDLPISWSWVDIKYSIHPCWTVSVLQLVPLHSSLYIITLQQRFHLISYPRYQQPIYFTALAPI